jgi:hypothetical protein
LAPVVQLVPQPPQLVVLVLMFTCTSAGREEVDQPCGQKGQNAAAGPCSGKHMTWMTHAWVDIYQEFHHAQA